MLLHATACCSRAFARGGACRCRVTHLDVTAKRVSRRVGCRRVTSLTESSSVGALNLSEHRSGLYGEGSPGEDSPRLSLSRPAARRLGLVGDEPGASAASSAEPEPDEVVSPRDDARKRRSSVRVSPLPQPLPPPAAAHAVKGDGSS